MREGRKGATSCHPRSGDKKQHSTRGHQRQSKEIRLEVKLKGERRATVHSESPHAAMFVRPRPVTGALEQVSKLFVQGGESLSTLWLNLDIVCS